MRSCSRGRIGRVRRAVATLALSALVASAGLADTITYVYDAAGRLIVVQHTNGTNTHYTLDPAGNRTNVVTGLDTTPPTVPASLTGTASSIQRLVTLSWSGSTDSGSGVGGYKVYRGGSQIGTANPSPTTYPDTTVACNTAYTYTVAAYDNATPPNVSAQSSGWSVTTPKIPPSTPVGLAGSSTSSTQVGLTWSASTDLCVALSGYQIYRNGSQIGTSTTTSYTDTTTSGTTNYSYAVAAYDSLGSVSGQSSTVSVTTPDTIPPSVPTGLSGTAVSSSQINLTWNASTDTGGSGLAGYHVYLNGTQLGPVTSNSFSDTGLAGSVTYSYTVSAYDNAGNVSAQSSAINVTTPAGAPTVPGNPEPDGVTVTSTPWTETWAASSGPVAYYIFNYNDGVNSFNNTVNAPNTSFDMNGANCTYYTMQVQACTSAGVCSAFSDSSQVEYLASGSPQC